MGQKVLKRGYIRETIGLPANLFYGTGNLSSIIVLGISEACDQRPVFMIYASRGFIKDGPKDRLHEDAAAAYRGDPVSYTRHPK